MLRRTVTVGTKYALHIWTVFLAVLCVLLSLLILSIGFDWESFAFIATLVAIYSTLGIIVSMYALWQIQNKAEQIKADVIRLKMLLNAAYGKHRE